MATLAPLSGARAPSLPADRQGPVALPVCCPNQPSFCRNRHDEPHQMQASDAVQPSVCRSPPRNYLSRSHNGTYDYVLLVNHKLFSLNRTGALNRVTHQVYAQRALVPQTMSRARQPWALLPGPRPIQVYPRPRTPLLDPDHSRLSLGWEESTEMYISGSEVHSDKPFKPAIHVIYCICYQLLAGQSTSMAKIRAADPDANVHFSHFFPSTLS